jgi:hypothetical protein
MRPSRRQLLHAGVVLTAACTAGGTPHRTSSPAPVDPDVGLLADAQAREVALLAAYDEVLAQASSAELASYRVDHAGHLDALVAQAQATSRMTPPATSGRQTPSATASGGTPTTSASHAGLPVAGPAVRQRLAALEHQTGRGHASGTGPASEGLAALLSSLAACEASHAALLS